jgi:hypothetical protein
MRARSCPSNLLVQRSIPEIARRRTSAKIWGLLSSLGTVNSTAWSNFWKVGQHFSEVDDHEAPVGVHFRGIRSLEDVVRSSGTYLWQPDVGHANLFTCVPGVFVRSSDSVAASKAWPAPPSPRRRTASASKTRFEKQGLHRRLFHAF